MARKTKEPMTPEEMPPNAAITILAAMAMHASPAESGYDQGDLEEARDILRAFVEDCYTPLEMEIAEQAKDKEIEERDDYIYRADEAGEYLLEAIAQGDPAHLRVAVERMTTLLGRREF